MEGKIQSFISVNKEEVEELIQEFRKTIDHAQRPEDIARGYFEIALLYKHLLKGYRECIKNLEKAFLSDHSNVRIVRELIVTYLKIGELNKARECYKKNTSLFIETPEHSDILDNILIFIEGKEELLEYEKELLEKRIKINSDDSRYLLKLENIYQSSQNFRKLYRLYKQYFSAFKMIRSLSDFAYDFLRVSRKVNPPRDVMREYGVLFDKETLATPPIIHELMSLGEATQEWVTFFDILRVYVETHSKEYDVSSTYALLGHIADDKLHNKEKAKNWYKKSLEVNPHNAVSLFYLENILLSEKDHEGLITFYKKRAESLPLELRENILVHEADMHLESKDKETALIEYQRLIHDYPTHVSSIRKVKTILRDEKNYEALLSVLKKEIFLYKEITQKQICYEEIAWILEEKCGTFLEAADFYMRAFEVVKKLDTNFYQAERIYKSLGEWKKLIFLYETAQKIVTNNTDQQVIERALSYVYEFHTRDFSHLEKILQTMYLKNKNDQYIRMRLLEFYRKTKEYDKLISLLLEVTGAYSYEERMKEFKVYAREFNPKEKTLYYEKLLQVINDQKNQLEILASLGTLYKDILKDNQKAEIAFLEILQLNPIDIFAKEALENIRLLEKK